jgi:hypothetical protein
MGGSRGRRDRPLIGDGDKILQLLEGVVEHLPSVGDGLPRTTAALAARRT